MSDLPSLHAVAAMLLVVVGLYLFASDRFSLPTAGLGILLVLALGSHFFPYPGLKPTEFFANFGDEALVTVCTLLLLVKGLEVTGALQPMTAFLSREWQRAPGRALPVTLLVAAVASAFMNDTPLMAILFPIVLAFAQRSGSAPSQVLMPLNIAILIGGMATTIGTSTNLLALGVATDLGVRPFALFDFYGIVLPATALGLVYLWVASTWLLPEHRPVQDESSKRVFSAVLYVNEDSYAQGRSVGELLERTGHRMQIDRISREEDLSLSALPSLKLLAGDRLYVRDTASQLKEYESLLGATLYNAGDLQHPVSERFPLDAAGQQLAEVVITRGSPLYQRALDFSDFVYRYRLLPLAIHRGRAAETGTSEMEEVRLRAGDVILAQGTSEAIRELRTSGSMLVLDGTIELPRTDRAPVALAIMIGVVSTNALGLISISVGALLGVALMLATRCLEWRHIPQALNASLVMTMVASLCLATALVKTGAAQSLASLLVAITPSVPVYFTLGLVMLAVTALTNFVTNNAVAVVTMPIGILMARQLGVPEEPFVLAIIFGANMPFATPYGYQTNTMIMGPGGYSEADYARIGIPLTLIMLAALTAALSTAYNLH